MKLLFDEMLKNLASWCRILGVDSDYASGKGDTELLSIAAEGGYVLITRDFPLAQRCEKRGVRCVLVKSDVLEEQIAQVLRETGAKILFPEKTRCAACNGELERAAPEDVRVPEHVAERNREFWRCKSCGKVYWEGSHWRNITKVFEKVKALL